MTPKRQAAPAQFTAVGEVARLLRDRDIDPDGLDYVGVMTMLCIAGGAQVTPRSTPSDAPPIVARVWLSSALVNNGRYIAPQTHGHPADLQDGGCLVDSGILMAIMQRHLLDAPGTGWDDETLGAQLGVRTADIGRAQVVLDQAVVFVDSPPAVAGSWWNR